MSRKRRKPKLNTNKVLKRLRRALDGQYFVRITRWFEGADIVSGFVVGLGTKWIAVASLDEGKHPDGWELIRLKDIQKVRVSADRTVEIRVLQARHQWPLAAPPLLLNGTSALLRSTASCAELVSVHTEKYNSGAMWVGALVDVNGGHLQLEGLDPEACWDDEVFSFKLRDISRVQIADSYTAALALVADPRPMRDPSAPLPLVPHRRGALWR